MPSATSIRMLGKLGLIKDWLGRNGSRDKQDGQSSHPEEDDRKMQTPGYAESATRVRVQLIRDAGERELVALYRAFPADDQKTILEVLHLVIAHTGPDARRLRGGTTNKCTGVE